MSDLEHIRISTLIANSKPGFSQIKFLLDSRNLDLQKVYVFPIKDCELGEDNRPENVLMKLKIQGKLFLLNRNRTTVMN